MSRLLSPYRVVGEGHREVPAIVAVVAMMKPSGDFERHPNPLCER